MKKLTKKEMFNVIINEMADNADVVAFCENEIALIEKKAAKAKETAAKKRAAGDELTDAVYAALGEDFAPIADIVAVIDGPDVTAAKVTYRLTQLVKNGKAVKETIEVPGAGEGAKARKVAGYKRA